jgi:hypothetical protein
MSTLQQLTKIEKTAIVITVRSGAITIPLIEVDAPVAERRGVAWQLGDPLEVQQNFNCSASTYQLLYRVRSSDEARREKNTERKSISASRSVQFGDARTRATIPTRLDLKM